MTDRQARRQENMCEALSSQILYFWNLNDICQDFPSEFDTLWENRVEWWHLKSPNLARMDDVCYETPQKKGQQALRLYSLANFVASWLKWLQMILNDYKGLFMHLIN